MANQWARKILLAIASTLLAFAFVEVGARTLLRPPRYHREPLELDPALGFRGIPSYVYSWVDPEDDRRTHEVALNRDGFRGRSSSDPRNSVAKRIAFVGDSFLVGEAVAEDALMTSLVEARWPFVGSSGGSSRGERVERVEVYNLSTIDYGTGQELLLVDRLRETLSPDVVVLMMYPTNDVVNNAPELAGRTRVSPGDAIRPYVWPREEGGRDIEWLMPSRARARRSSRIFAWIERGLFPPRLDEVSWDAPRDRMRRGESPREFLEVYRRHDDPGHRWQVAWRRTEALIRAIRDRCAEMEAELLVGVIPSVDQVVLTPKRVRFEIEARIAGKSLSDLVDWNYPEARLAHFLSAEKIEAVFLLGECRQEANRGQQLYSRDQHLARQGHELAARMLTDALTTDASYVTESPHRTRTNPESERPVIWEVGSDPVWLDLRWDPHTRHFGDGWQGWQAERANRAGGWWLAGPDALVVIRAAEGMLVVRGIAFEPIELEIGFLGSAPRRTVISRAGPFEAKLEPSRGFTIAPSGHTAVVVKALGDDARVLFQDFGFENANRSDGSVGEDGEP